MSKACLQYLLNKIVNRHDWCNWTPYFAGGNHLLFATLHIIAPEISQRSQSPPWLSTCNVAWCGQQSWQGILQASNLLTDHAIAGSWTSCGEWLIRVLVYASCALSVTIKLELRRQKNSLLWHHNGRKGVSNHHDCLLNRLFRRRSTKTSKLRVTGLCAGNFHQWHVNSPPKWPITRKMLPFDDVIMINQGGCGRRYCQRAIDWSELFFHQFKAN